MHTFLIVLAVLAALLVVFVVLGACRAAGASDAAAESMFDELDPKDGFSREELVKYDIYTQNWRSN